MVPETIRSLVLTGCLALLVTACASKPEPQPVVDNSAEAAELAGQAWQLQQEGNDGQALERYRQAFAMDPDNAMTANNLALLLREQGKFQEARALLKEGLQHSPDTAELHYNLAVISELYLLDLETALNHYQRYRDLTGEEDKQVAGWIADLERRLE